MRKLGLMMIALSLLMLLAVFCCSKKNPINPVDAIVKVIRPSGGHGTAFQVRVGKLYMIITNAHVCGKERKLYVTNDYGQLGVVSVVRSDAKVDLCVLTGIATLPSLELNDSGPKSGDAIHIIGYPFSYPRQRSDGYYGNFNYANTQVFPGNSGSPVLNEEGKVVGVVTATTMDTGFTVIVSLTDLRNFVAGK